MPILTTSVHIVLEVLFVISKKNKKLSFEEGKKVDLLSMFR